VRMVGPGGLCGQRAWAPSSGAYGKGSQVIPIIISEWGGARVVPGQVRVAPEPERGQSEM
jgi:hypothetical protein